jgi:hypothetical protein
MKPIIVATALALLSGCAGLSGSGNAAAGSTATGYGTANADAPLYLQNPANTENSYSRLR